jgi:hypothetical protein
MTDTATTTYTGEEIAELLRAGAREIGRNTTHAAVHLLTYTELVNYPRFVAEHLDIVVKDGVATAAFVRDWAAARDSDLTRRAGSSVISLMTLAAGWATGEPVDVRDAFSGYSTATADRVAEAVTIATGAAGY